MIGRTISHYEVVEKLGEGGMGVVYKARDTRLGRLVAIKVVNAEFTQRFEREARAISALNHPHICTLYDVGVQQGASYLVMEYVEGRPLRGPLPAGRALPYAIQVCEALAAAHKAGIIHRDLKPENILLTTEGSVKVLDFGLAKLQHAIAAHPTTAMLTLQGAVMGTAAYMSPEQAKGEPVDERSDIFSFGVVLYELLSGRRAFQRETLGATLAAVFTSDPPPLRGAPPEIAGIIRKMLAKSREERYRSAEELRAHLEAAALPGLSRVQRLWLAPILGRKFRQRVTALLSASGRTPRSEPVTGKQAQAPERRSIRTLAVLPLANLSGDTEQEYFADGMTEALIAGMAKLHALRITSRTSVMRYKRTDKSVAEIARELDVDAIVEGSVLRDGNRVRITAQLIDAVSDTHLWAESYERDLKNVLYLQSEVTQAIVREIQAATTSAERRQLESARPVDAEAYDAYLKGRFHLYMLSEQGLNTAEEYFKYALEKDPSCALAFVGIGSAWMMRGDAGFLPHGQAAPKARAAIARALELDDTLAEAHIWLGNSLVFEWNWPSAEREYQTAIQLNPSAAEAHFFYADLLISLKRFGESREECRQALELDPLNSFTQCFAAWHLIYQGKYEEAIARLNRVLAVEPNFSSAHMGLWGAFYKKGQYEKALDQARQFFAVLGDTEVVEAGDQGRTESGYHGAMRCAAQTLAARSTHTHVPAVRIARLYAHAGEIDLAFHWLEKAYEQHESPLLHLGVGWDWEGLRGDTRFKSLLERVNLPI